MKKILIKFGAGAAAIVAIAGMVVMFGGMPQGAQAQNQNPGLLAGAAGSLTITSATLSGSTFTVSGIAQGGSASQGQVCPKVAGVATVPPQDIEMNPLSKPTTWSVDNGTNATGTFTLVQTQKGESQPCGQASPSAQPWKYSFSFTGTLTKVPGTHTIEVCASDPSGLSGKACDTAVLTGMNTGGAFISIRSVTPNPATNQITVSGTARGALLFGEGIYCPDGSGKDIYLQGSLATPLVANGYSLDSGTGGTGSYTLTETKVGVSTNNCPALLKGSVVQNPTASPYEYSFSFTDNTNIAPLSQGAHTVTVCALGGICDVANFQVGGGGKITVASESSVDQNTPVNSSWVLLGNISPSTMDVCSFLKLPCDGTYQEYPGVTLGPNYTVSPIKAVGFTFHSVKEIPIAEKQETIFSELFSFGERILAPIANAWRFPPNNPPSQTPDVLHPTANFVILWDPVAVMTINPTTLNLDLSNLSKNVTISNGGTQGSELTVTSMSVSPSSAAAGNGGWLSVSSLPTNSLVQGASAQMTFTADPANAPQSCAAGCTATVTFKGSSTPNGSKYTSPEGSVSITFTNSASNGGCVSGNCPPPPSGRSCVAPGSCPAIVITPSQVPPTPVGVPVPVTCAGGNGTYSWTATGPASPATGSGSNFMTTYASTGTYQITCSSGGASASTPVVIVPDCSLGASPQQIVPPAASTLSWSCVQGTAQACVLSGPSVSRNVNPSGSYAVNPAQGPAIYTLSCRATNGTNALIPPPSVTVTTQNPGVIETTP